MNKKRNMFLLYLIFNMLSISTIVVGVFSLCSANLNINGSLGYVKSTQANLVAQISGASSQSFLYIKDDGTTTTDLSQIGIEKTNVSKQLTFGNLDFTDINSPIKFEINLTNNTTDPIVVDIDCESLTLNNTRIAAELDANYMDIIPQKGGTCKLYFSLYLIEKKETTNAVSGNISININRANLQTASEQGFTISDSDTTGYVNINGIPASSTTNATLIVPSYFYTETKNGVPQFKKVKSIGVKTYDVWDPDLVPNLSNYTNVIISNGISIITNGAFYKGNLSSLSLPSSLEEISKGAFHYGCKFTDLIIPSRVRYIGTKAFADNMSITKLILGNNVTEINYSFCSLSITELVLPYSLQYIFGHSLDGCGKLKSITFTDTESTWQYANAYSSSWEDYNYDLTDEYIKSCVLKNIVSTSTSYKKKSYTIRSDSY